MMRVNPMVNECSKFGRGTKSCKVHTRQRRTRREERKKRYDRGVR
jgi:hypothetical protein